MSKKQRSYLLITAFLTVALFQNCQPYSVVEDKTASASVSSSGPPDPNIAQPAPSLSPAPTAPPAIGTNNVGSCIYKGQVYKEDSVVTVTTDLVLEGTTPPYGYTYKYTIKAPFDVLCSNGEWMRQNVYATTPTGSVTMGPSTFMCTPADPNVITGVALSEVHGGFKCTQGKRYPIFLISAIALNQIVPKLHGKAPFTVTAKVAKDYVLHWGDGTTSTVADSNVYAVQHTFNIKGNYTIKLTSPANDYGMTDFEFNIRVD